MDVLDPGVQVGITYNEPQPEVDSLHFGNFRLLKHAATHSTRPCDLIHFLPSSAAASSDSLFMLRLRGYFSETDGITHYSFPSEGLLAIHKHFMSCSCSYHLTESGRVTSFAGTLHWDHLSMLLSISLSSTGSELGLAAGVLAPYVCSWLSEPRI